MSPTRRPTSRRWTKTYTELDYVCDLSAIPVEGERFDLVICTQVMEHIADPVAVLRELGRVLRPGGEIWFSASSFYEEHEQAFDYFRYTQFAMAARVLPRRLLPVRAFLGVLAGLFARLDLRHRHID